IRFTESPLESGTEGFVPCPWKVTKSSLPEQSGRHCRVLTLRPGMPDTRAPMNRHSRFLPGIRPEPWTAHLADSLKAQHDFSHEMTIFGTDTITYQHEITCHTTVPEGGRPHRDHHPCQPYRC